MRLLIATAVLVLLAGCAAAHPPGTPFTAVELPGGAVPARIAADGADLVVAAHRDGRPVLLRYAGGRATEVPLRPATTYGASAAWYSLTARDHEVLAIGGRAGGAHSNIRWSVWRTAGTGLAEQPQLFSTFGGYGGAALVDGVLPTTGPLLVGTWKGETTGADVALWTTDGTRWSHQSSAGTPLESTGAALNFPMSAAALGADVVITGWQVAEGRQRPVVWTVRDGVATPTPLPDGGRAGVGTTVSCAETCAVAGAVDGRLAVWRRDGNAWRRVGDVPDVPVDEQDRPVPPVGDTLVYSDRGTVRVATLGGDASDVFTAAGPTGVVTAVARVGDTTYVLAGPDEDNQTLWRAGRS